MHVARELRSRIDVHHRRLRGHICGTAIRIPTGATNSRTMCLRTGSTARVHKTDRAHVFGNVLMNTGVVSKEEPESCQYATDHAQRNRLQQHRQRSVSVQGLAGRLGRAFRERVWRHELRAMVTDAEFATRNSSGWARVRLSRRRANISAKRRPRRFRSPTSRRHAHSRADDGTPTPSAAPIPAPTPRRRRRPRLRRPCHRPWCDV